MREFVIKIAALGLTVIVLCAGLSRAYQHATADTGLIRSFANMPLEIGVANTGSSHGVRAFDYTEYQSEGSFSFALTSQSMVYDSSLVDQYVDHFVPGAVLFIPLSYFTFWYREIDQNDFASKNARYLGILPPDHMRFRDRTDKIISVYFSAATVADNWVRTVIRADAERVVEATDMPRAEIGRRRAAFHCLDMYDRDGHLMEMDPANIEALDSLIALCLENQVTPVLVTTPYMEHYAKWFPDQLLDVFYGQIDEYVARYGIEYWDYSQHPAFAHNEQFFTDTDHLSETGARIFTGMLMERAGVSPK